MQNSDISDRLILIIKTKTNVIPKLNITPILKSLHWLKINERIEFKLLSITYKILTTSQPPYLRRLITVQPPRSTRSSSVVTLLRPPSHSTLKITNRSFSFAAPRLWNSLPESLRHPDSINLSCASSTASQIPLLLPPVSHFHFHSKLKSYLFQKYF